MAKLQYFFFFRKRKKQSESDEAYCLKLINRKESLYFHTWSFPRVIFQHQTFSCYLYNLTGRCNFTYHVSYLALAAQTWQCNYLWTNEFKFFPLILYYIRSPYSPKIIFSRNPWWLLGFVWDLLLRTEV